MPDANVKIITYPGAKPVFVVGCVRSGTSAVVTALRESAGYKGYGEGNVAPLLFKLQQVIERHYAGVSEEYLRNPAHMISHVERKDLKIMAANMIGSVMHGLMGDGRWLDKTAAGADMVRSCPILLEIFPEAKFIFCKRRAVENILSRQRKFPDTKFTESCHHWADTMHSWMQVRTRLQGHFLEVDQRDMAVHSVKVAKAIGGLLKLDAAEIDAMGEIFQNRRVEQTRAATDSRYLGLDETGWDEELKRQFRNICLPMMKAYGYPLEGGGDDDKISPVKLFYPLEASKDNTIEQHNVVDNGFSAIDQDVLQLHPNPPGKCAAEVRYLNIPLSGHSRFSAQLLLAHKESQPVRYGLRIEESQGRNVVTSAQQVVSAGKEQPWVVDMPILRGVYDVVISTEMAEGSDSSHYAWARWRQAHLA